MKERVILRAMLDKIDLLKPDPLNDLKAVLYKSPTKKNPAKKQPFYFDPRRGNKSHPLDSGFSPDTHKMQAECCPTLEALCFIGLQRARPASTGVANQSRVISSIVRAFNVTQLKRSAQYSPPIKYEQEGLLPSGLEGKPADHGLADVPSTHKIGGIQVRGDIRRDFSLNLSVLRALKGANPDETAKLQRYVLGLALVAITATPESNLRQGSTAYAGQSPKRQCGSLLHHARQPMGQRHSGDSARS